MELHSLFPIQILRLLLNQVTYDCPHFKISVLVKYMVMERDLTPGGEHIKEHTDDVLYTWNL